MYCQFNKQINYLLICATMVSFLMYDFKDNWLGTCTKKVVFNIYDAF